MKIKVGDVVMIEYGNYITISRIVDGGYWGVDSRGIEGFLSNKDIKFIWENNK